MTKIRFSAVEQSESDRLLGCGSGPGPGWQVRRALLGRALQGEGHTSGASEHLAFAVLDCGRDRMRAAIHVADTHAGRGAATDRFAIKQHFYRMTRLQGRLDFDLNAYRAAIVANGFIGLGGHDANRLVACIFRFTRRRCWL